MEFLRARWHDLLLVSYAVPDTWLRPYLPPGLMLDRWEGHACVSLVAFDFAETRVAGLAWRGFQRFPEVNLRFYVRDGDRRGVGSSASTCRAAGWPGWLGRCTASRTVPCRW